MEFLQCQPLSNPHLFPQNLKPLHLIFKESPHLSLPILHHHLNKTHQPKVFLVVLHGVFGFFSYFLNHSNLKNMKHMREKHPIREPLLLLLSSDLHVIKHKVTKVHTSAGNGICERKVRIWPFRKDERFM